ncbi:MAG: FtsX-like permease family protein [Chromatiales bacterium]|jgi:lipoprotein-releasing system permease protein|nr:FtsX-like permease family protein [Chromatiales bacterium]
MYTEWNLAVKFLRDARGQTAMISVAITVGVAVIIYIVALITGLQANMINRTLGTQAHIKVYAPKEINLPAPLENGELRLMLEDPRAQRLRSINNWQNLRDLFDADAELLAVSPLASGPAFAQRGTAHMSVALIGIDPVRYQRVIPIANDIIAGEFRIGAGNAVVGSRLADELGLHVSDKLRIDAGGSDSGREAVLSVTGIFELGVRELDERYIYLDLPQAQALLGLPGGITTIDLLVPDVFSAERIAARLHHLTGLKVESWMQTNSQLMSALKAQRLSTSMISFFVAISVAFGIASVLSISIVQRTREIGILRAMGATRRQMLTVFLLQGALLGLAGAIAGSACSYALAWAFNTFGPGLFQIVIWPGLLISASAIATLTGLIAAAIPARRAARLDPVAAIRYA